MNKALMHAFVYLFTYVGLPRTGLYFRGFEAQKKLSRPTVLIGLS